MTDETKKLMGLSEEELATLYKQLFNNDTGKLVLEDLRNRCFVKTSTANESAYKTFLCEGMRSVCLYIETNISYEPPMEEQGE